jgi:hypothetical protein
MLATSTCIVYVVFLKSLNGLEFCALVPPAGFAVHPSQPSAILTIDEGFAPKQIAAGVAVW